MWTTASRVLRGVVGPQRGRPRVQHVRRRRHLVPCPDEDVEERGRRVHLVIELVTNMGGDGRAGRSSGAALTGRVLSPH